VIDEYLAGEDWNEAPLSMGFEAPYGEILDEAAWLVASLRDKAGSSPEEASAWAMRLYVLAPAFVNVTLNYKICTEHGLPLHPTVYYELAESRKYRIEHPISEIERANRLYRSSIDLARAALRLDVDWETRASSFRALLPGELPGFVYTGGVDKYTWRASEPATLSALAEAIRPRYEPRLLVAAAHGSIMPSLLLAEYLGIPLYFVRFSMFKRHDEAPIISLADLAWLDAWRMDKVLVFDEDVARGRTLELFNARVASLFAEARTACSIRHAGAAFRPDFCARIWWE
jgi:hypothetical protein